MLPKAVLSPKPLQTRDSQQPDTLKSRTATSQCMYSINRRVPDITHGGVRGRGYSIPSNTIMFVVV